MAKREINIDKLPSNNETEPNDAPVNLEEPVLKGAVHVKRSKGTAVTNWVRDLAISLGKEVVIPTLKGMITEFVQTGIERAVYGNESSSRRSSYSRSGYTNYATYGRNPTYVNARNANPSTAFMLDTFYFEERTDAENILNRLYQEIIQYKKVSVGTYYSLVGVSPTQVHYAWGWKTIQGSRVQLTQGGHQIILPEPTPLD